MVQMHGDAASFFANLRFFMAQISDTILKPWHLQQLLTFLVLGALAAMLINWLFKSKG